MKKIVIMILVIFAGLLNGCAKADSKPSDAIIVYGAMGTTTTYSDLGVFENERGILYYFDPVTGIRAPLCSKVVPIPIRPVMLFLRRCITVLP